MNEPDGNSGRRFVSDKNRMPNDSLFYERIVPLMLVGLGIVMLVLIVIATGVLLGIVPFQ